MIHLMMRSLSLIRKFVITNIIIIMTVRIIVMAVVGVTIMVVIIILIQGITISCIKRARAVAS